MKRELVVLVKSEELPVHVERYNAFYGHLCTAYDKARLSRDLEPDEVKAITRVQEFAKRKNIEFRILRISGLRVMMRFRLGRRAKTPVVICGKNVFHGVPSMKDLAELVS